MRFFKNPFISILILLLFGGFHGFNQNIEQEDSLDLKIRDAAMEIMTAASTCALITIDHEGKAQARAMDPFLPESDFKIWFGTNPYSRKVDQIRNDSRVTLYYLAEGNSGYVTMNGTAELIDDPKEKATRWKEEWAAFYSDYPENYLLIKVTPVRIEVVSYLHGITGDTETWEPPALIFDENGRE